MKITSSKIPHLNADQLLNAKADSIIRAKWRGNTLVLKPADDSSAISNSLKKRVHKKKYKKQEELAASQLGFDKSKITLKDLLDKTEKNKADFSFLIKLQAGQFAEHTSDKKNKSVEPKESLIENIKSFHERHLKEKSAKGYSTNKKSVEQRLNRLGFDVKTETPGNQKELAEVIIKTYKNEPEKSHLILELVPQIPYIYDSQGVNKEKLEGIINTLGDEPVTSATIDAIQWVLSNYDSLKQYSDKVSKFKRNHQDNLDVKKQALDKAKIEKRYLEIQQSAHEKQLLESKLPSSKAWDQVNQFGLDNKGEHISYQQLYALLSNKFSHKIADALYEKLNLDQNSSSIPTSGALYSLAFILENRYLSEPIMQKALEYQDVSIIPFRQFDYTGIGINGICEILAYQWFISQSNQTDFMDDIGYDWIEKGKYSEGYNDQHDRITSEAIKYKAVFRKGVNVDAFWQGDQFKPSVSPDAVKEKTVPSVELGISDLYTISQLSENGFTLKTFYRKSEPDNYSFIKGEGAYHIGFAHNNRGHSISAFVGKSEDGTVKYKLFDPNFGEFTFKDKSDLVHFIKTLRKEIYPHLDTHMDIGVYSCPAATEKAK